MKKVLVSFLFVSILAVGGFFVWQNQNERARAAKLEAEILKGLTAEEIGLILQSEALADRESITLIKESPERRQAFLKGMREYLAMAAQARREGFAEDANFKINVEYKKNILLADLYRAKLTHEQGKFYVVPEEEINAVWADPKNEELFSRDIKTLQEIQKTAAKVGGSQMSASELAGESLKKARSNWAQTKILSERAKADRAFMQRPEISLRLKIVEAGILSSDYLRSKWASRIKATEAEIAEYLAAHPEYSVEKKRQKAEEVLRRAKADDDFTKLAAEYSEDRRTKETGGLYKDIATNVVWAEVEAAALKLEKGQIVENLIESSIGYHIVKLEDKKRVVNADGRETYTFSVRHILLQKNFEEPGEPIPGIPPPFMSPREIAVSQVEKRKRDALIAEIIRQNPVSLPDDFTLDLPEIGN